MLLTDLPNGADAIVARVTPISPDIDTAVLPRLGELGFLPGEPLKLLRRGPGGREPLAVQIGQTTLAVVKRETNSWHYPLAMAAYLFALAYVAAFVTYRVRLWLGG